jgi:hypothetical protein
MRLNSGNNFFSAQISNDKSKKSNQQDAGQQNTQHKNNPLYDVISTNQSIFCHTPTLPTPPKCNTPAPPKCDTPAPPPPAPTPCPAPTPPTPTPPTPTPCPPPTTPPPLPPSAVKQDGSLNISGDPTLTTTTPNVASTSMSFTPPVGQNFNVLTDPDNNFSMNVNLHTINPQGKTGIEQASFTAGGHAIQFANDGSLMVDGVNRGTLANGVSSIDLGNGITARTAQMDDGGGKTATRFVLDTPDYQVTAALRQPTGAGSYYDVNIAENKADAADNATGSLINGQTVSVADLLKKEPT